MAGTQEVVLDLGLSLNAFGDVRKFMRHDFGSGSIDEQTAAVRVLLSYQTDIT